jgi:hypothetical protein
MGPQSFNNASPFRPPVGFFRQGTCRSPSPEQITEHENWTPISHRNTDISPAKASKLSDKHVKALANNARIVRNEKKIWATTGNALSVVDREKEHASFGNYTESFGNKEKLLLEDLPRRSKFMGPPTAWMFLYMLGYPLTPIKEEKAWMKAHPEHH